MATYYVDKTNGSDSNAGTTEATAWATVGKAVGYTSLAAGDTIWIAPGTYFETLTFTTDGSSGTPIVWRGDPDCTRNWGTGVEPGPVKISGASSSTLVPAATSTGPVVNLTGVAYNTFYDLCFDGLDLTGTGSLVLGDYSYGQLFVRCSFIGGYHPVSYCSVEDSFILGNHYAGYGSNDDAHSYIKNTVIISGYKGPESCRVEQCIIFSYIGFSSSNNLLNSIILSAYYGVYYVSSSVQVDNNIFLGCYYAAVADSDNDMGNNLICAKYDTTASLTIDWSSSNIIYHYTKNASTPPGDGHIFSFRSPLDIKRKIASALKFIEYNDYGIGDNTNTTSETTDIEGRARSFRPSDETSDQKGQGPWALTDYSLKYDSTDGNKIRIEKKGEEILYIPLKADTAISISVDVDSGNLSATPVYPEIELEPEVSGLFTAVTDTAASTSDTLTVSLTTATAPDYDCMARLILKAKDTNTNAYAEFHSIEIS